MTEQARRPGLPQALTGAAVVAVAVHLFGLYRPTGPPSPSWFPHADKAEHLLGFGLPVLLLLLAARAWVPASTGAVVRRDRQRHRLGPLVAAVFAAHAVVSELVQHFFYSGRTGDPLDALADLVGVALGWAASRPLAARLPPAGPAIGPSTRPAIGPASDPPSGPAIGPPSGSVLGD